MKDQLVSLEVAKLLKEKGFVNLSDKSYVISEGARYGLLSNFTNKCNNSVEKDRIEAPTQALAQKWLREKHEIYLAVLSNNENAHRYVFGEGINSKRYAIWYKTYEEALEEGLKEGLMLI